MRRRPTKTIVAASVGALMIFAVTVLASQVAVLMHEGATTRLVERIGDVYLDGLSAAVAPHLENGRTNELQKVLERMASYHDGVREVRLVIRAVGGEVLADLARDDAAKRSELPPAREEVSLTSSEDRGRLWVQRPLMIGGHAVAVLSAQLDVKPIRDERFAANMTSLVLNAALAVLLAAIGFFVMRRLLQPLRLLEAALVDAVDGDPRPIPLETVKETATRVDRLLVEYNRMAAASAERSQLQLLLAERLRSADLGRLAATIAHEVRNPLSGMLNAVDTARRFRDNPDAVAASLDLLERGLRAIARVVETTLSLHRPSTRHAAMKPIDFDDLERLLAPLAERQNTRLQWSADVGHDWAVDAAIVRQIVLNLAINALAAAGSGVATLALPGSAGVPAPIAAQTLVLPYNDLDAVREAFAVHGENIAAIIVEAASANMGVVPPLPGFNAALADIAYVNRIPQAFYHVHPESMMRTVYRGSFLDLRQRKAAFDSFFQHDAASIANAHNLRNLANRSLAREALWDACRAYDRNEVAVCHVEELVDFAITTYPNAASLPEYAALRRRQWLGPVICNRTQIFAAPALLRKVQRAALKQRWKHQGV